MAPDITLRFLETSDADSLKDVFNEPLFREYEMGPHPFTIEDATRYIDNSIKLREHKKTYIYGMFAGKELVGVTSVHDINWIHKSGELFYWTRKDMRNKGIGLAGVEKMLELAFNKYGLHRIEAKMRQDNTGSVKLAEKLGFKLEGKLRDKYFNNSRHYDAFEYALLRSESE